MKLKDDPNKLLQQIKSKFSECTRKKCEENNCRLEISLNFPFIILKGEDTRNCLSSPSDKVCDYVLFIIPSNKIIIILIEIKNRPKISKVEGQFRCGLDLLHTILRVCDYDLNIINAIYLILVYKYIRSTEFKLLKNIKIKFMGKIYKIKTKKCGENINSILR